MLVVGSSTRNLELVQDVGSETIKLRDGRRAGYAEYGDLGGWPLAYCHGWPSSRAEGLLADHAAEAGGARMIVIGRPGVAGLIALATGGDRTRAVPP